MACVPTRVVFREVGPENYNHLKCTGQIKALQRLGAEVLWIRSGESVEAVDRFDADLLIASHLNEADLAFVAKRRASHGLRVINYDANELLLDAPDLVDLAYVSWDVDDSNAGELPAHLGRAYNRDRYARAGVRMVYCPLAADPDEFHPVHDAQTLFDVSFAGTLYNRPLIQRLVHARTDLRLGLYGPDTRGVLDPAGLNDLYAATLLCPNVHGHETFGMEANIRTFELAMCGALQLVDLPERIGPFFSEDEVAFYRSEAEFFDRLDFFLENPIARIARGRAARERALAEHTWDHRIAYLLSFVD